jgi:hypothetical protein
MRGIACVLLGSDGLKFDCPGVCEGEDKEGSIRFDVASDPGGRDGDDVGASEFDKGSDGLLGAEGVSLGESGRFGIVAFSHFRSPRSG